MLEKAATAEIIVFCEVSLDTTLLQVKWKLTSKAKSRRRGREEKMAELRLKTFPDGDLNIYGARRKVNEPLEQVNFLCK
jgi:hypothetical protein